MTTSDAHKRNAEAAGVDDRDVLARIIYAKTPGCLEGDGYDTADAILSAGWHSPAMVEAAKREAVREYIETKEVARFKIETTTQQKNIIEMCIETALAEQRESIAMAIDNYDRAARRRIDGPPNSNILIGNVIDLARTFTKGDRG